MKKRILSLVLAALTVFALCAPAFAADEPVDEPAAPVAEEAPAVEEVPEAEPEDAPAAEEPEAVPEETLAEEPAPEEAPAEEPAEEPAPEEAPAEEPAEEPADQPEEAAATSGTCGANVKWSLSADSTLTISGTGKMKDYSLMSPEEMPPWYSMQMSPDEVTLNSTIKKIVIKSGVTHIGDWAFYSCDNAASITIPGSVTSIGENAFSGCDFTSVTIPESVTSIGAGAFYACHSLTSVNIPKGVKVIEDSLFYGCLALKSITIPNGVTTIGAQAFGGCPLTSVDLPSSVTLIYEAAFGGCMDLTDLTIRNSKCEIGREADLGWFGAIGGTSDTTIHGYAGSTAEAYAKEYNIKFAALSGGTTPTPTVKKGWVTEDGKKYYYQNGEKLKGIWVIGGKRYYFSVKDGAMLKGLVTVDNKGTKRYFSAKTGEQLVGLVTTDNKGTQRYFSTKDGHMMKNGWANVGGGKQVQLDKNGVVIAKKGF